MVAMVFALAPSKPQSKLSTDEESIEQTKPEIPGLTDANADLTPERLDQLILLLKLGNYQLHLLLKLSFLQFLSQKSSSHARR